MKNNKFLHFLKTEVRTQRTMWLIYTVILAVLATALIAVVSLTLQMTDELTEFVRDEENRIYVSSTDPEVFRKLEKCPVFVAEYYYFYSGINGFSLTEEYYLRKAGIDPEDLDPELQNPEEDNQDSGPENEQGQPSEREETGDTQEPKEMIRIEVPDTWIIFCIDPDKDYYTRYINTLVLEGETIAPDYNHIPAVWISGELAAYRGLQVGDTVAIPYYEYSGKKVTQESMDCKVMGIISEEGYWPLQCVFSYEAGRRLLGAVPFRIPVEVNSILDYNRVASDLRDAGAYVGFGYMENETNERITGYIYILYAMFSVNFIVLIMFGSVLVMLVRMYACKRTRFFAMLRTSGMTGKDCTVLTVLMFAACVTVAFVQGFALSPIVVSLVSKVFEQQFIECSLSASPFAIRNLLLYAICIAMTALIVTVVTRRNRRSEIVDGLHRDL